MTIEARIHRAHGALTTLSNGRQVWNADLDGTQDAPGQAPDPHDLLDSALAACTALTLELYIRHKGLPVTDIRVAIVHQEHKDSTGKVHYRLERSLELTGDLTPEQRQRLHEIAGRCPIHRVLTGEIRIEDAPA